MIAPSGTNNTKSNPMLLSLSIVVQGQRPRKPSLTSDSQTPRCLPARLWLLSLAGGGAKTILLACP
jgi:hypothetical protein